MHIAYEGAYTWQVVSIEKGWSSGQFGRHIGVTFGAKGKSPKLGTTWFLPTAEKEVVVSGVDCD